MDVPDSVLPDDWSTDVHGYLICPCGYAIEPDGECPEGHLSPLRQQGLI